MGQGCVGVVVNRIVVGVDYPDSITAAGVDRDSAGSCVLWIERPPVDEVAVHVVREDFVGARVDCPNRVAIGGDPAWRAVAPSQLESVAVPLRTGQATCRAGEVVNAVG